MSNPESVELQNGVTISEQKDLRENWVAIIAEWIK